MKEFLDSIKALLFFTVIGAIAFALKLFSEYLL